MQEQMDIQQEICKAKAKVLSVYQELPAQMTQWKRQHVMAEGSFNQRLVGLGFACLGVTALSYKAGLGILRVTRNSVLSYGLIGQFVVPEIFNPYLLKKPLQK